MYDLLVKHPDVVSYHPKKEYCLRHEGDWNEFDAQDVSEEWTKQKQEVQELLARSHREHHLMHQKETRLTINGCVDEMEVDVNYRYVRPDKPVKIIFSLRDPADLLWSAYNYFPLRDHDSQFFRARDPTKYRTPSHFHDSIASGNLTKLGSGFFTWKRLLTVTAPRRLIKMVGRENVIFVKNEDMHPDVVGKKGGVLDHLSTELGISREGFGNVFVSNSTNTGAYRASSNHRFMYPETRQLIYLQFLEECKVWATEFGIEYPDCLNILHEVDSRGE